jgi:hypothetical protein
MVAGWVVRDLWRLNFDALQATPQHALQTLASGLPLPALKK